MGVDVATLATAYAAVVATGALALEVRRWFESGPKLVVKAQPNMTLINAGGPEREGLLLVNVSNRGEGVTTITHFGLLEFPDAISRWQRKASNSFIVAHPYLAGMNTALPYVLRPGEMWTGFADGKSEATGDLQSGTMWVAIYTTDREKPYLALIPKRSIPVELQDAKKV